MKVITPDEELVAQALAGDAEALAALFERNRPSLYASAVALLGSRADALDALQDTCVVALLRLSDLRDGGAAAAWLHVVLRNICLMRLRERREIPSANIEVSDNLPGPEQALDEHVMREWLWHALDTLTAEERLTVMLRHFTRCSSYQAIARVTAVPVGTVRSRLNRARSRLADALLAKAAGTPLSHAALESERREQWEDFYRGLHERPVPLTYAGLFAPEVDVRDPGSHWHGISEWSAEERSAITVGVRASIVGLLASRDITVLEIDFHNPPNWPDHCPPQATFVHQLRNGRSHRLQIHYPAERVGVD